MIFQFTKRTIDILDIQSLLFNAGTLTVLFPLHLKLAAWFYVKDNMEYEGNIKGYLILFIVNNHYKIHKTISETSL